MKKRIQTQLAIRQSWYARRARLRLGELANPYERGHCTGTYYAWRLAAYWAVRGDAAAK